MSVESATYISQLTPSIPADSDGIPEGDNHIRLVKQVLQNSLPNLGAAAMTATAAQLNTITDRSLRAGDTYTGAHDFTGATLTGATPVSAAQLAPKSYVDAFVVGATSPTWAVTTSAVSKTLAAFELCVVTASGQTMTFPVGPTSGVTRIGIEYAAGITGTLDPGAEKIKGSAGTMTALKPGQTLLFTYINSTIGWVLGA